MSFKFEEGKMYMMPVVFGPAVTPRQKPEGGRWIYDSPTKTTHYKVVCEVSAEKLESILPEKYELLSPHVIITFSALRNIAWLQGGGYDILHVEVPVHFKGEKDDFIANFEPVLWEDVTDAILTGRDQLGYSKIFGFIKTMTEDENGVARGSIATHEFTFLDMVVDTNAEPEDPETLKQVLHNPENKGKVHFKYFPRTGEPFTTSDVCYSVLGPSNWNPPEDLPKDCPATETKVCKGELIWHKPEWKDAPAQARIIQFLCDMGFKKYVGAEKSVVYSHADVYAQHIVE